MKEKVSKEGEEHTSARTFRRDPGAPFDDYRVETFCKARAQGGSLAVAAHRTGISKATATKWEREPEVRARQRELREGAEDFIGVSVAWVIKELKTNVEAAREQGAIKASNEALVFIYKIMTENKAAAHQMASALPASLEGKDLQKALRESFRSPEETIDVVAEPVAVEVPDDGDAQEVG